jgi:hypothetical protein
MFAFACKQQKKANDTKHANGTKSANDTENNFKYPRVIDSLNMREMYDQDKWAMYCLYCDDTCYMERDKDEPRLFSTLDLRLKEVRQFNDTVEMDFNFYIHDTLRCKIAADGNRFYIKDGVGYRRGSDSIIYYTSSTTMKRFWERGLKSRYANPLQPDVVTFIKDNKEKLNPWFREEAKKRGVLQ